MNAEIDEHLVRATQRYLFERAKQLLRQRQQLPPPIILVICRRHPISGEPLAHDGCLVPVISRHHETEVDVLTRARAVAIAGDAYASCALGFVPPSDDTT